MRILRYIILPATVLAFTILPATLTLAEDPVTAKTTEKTEEPTVSSLRQALSQGKTSVILRYRFETVHEDAFRADANASTLRTTLSYGTAPYKGFSLFLEAEDVSVLGNDALYNNAGAFSLNNGVRDRPVVADPEITAINQAWAQLELGDSEVRLGRQEIALCTHRFIGNVGWRQHHQSFDSASLINHSLPNTTLAYYYLDRVNRIFGDSKSMSSHLLHGEFEGLEHGTITAYVYELNFDQAADAGLSTTTYGVRWDGHHQFSRGKLEYVLETAQQQETGDNPNTIDAGYSLLEVSGGRPSLTASLGYEILEGSPGDGSFRTPLATLHKFNGFADKFLNTPVRGLVDLYGGVGGKIQNFTWNVVYHDFSSDSEGIDYGSEFDLLATWKSRWGQTFGFKAALYDADTFSVDTEKFILWSSWRFGT